MATQEQHTYKTKPGYFVELQAHWKEEVGYACAGVILFCKVDFVYIIASKACFDGISVSDPDHIDVFFVDGSNTHVKADDFVIFEHFVGISCPLDFPTDDRVVSVTCDNKMVTREQAVHTICLEDLGSNAVVTSGIVGKTEELFFYHNCRARRYTEYGGPVFDDKRDLVGLCYDRPCGILAALTVKSIEDSLSKHYDIANTGMDEILRHIYATHMSRDDRASHGTPSNSTGCSGVAQAPPSQWSMENSERKNRGYWRSEDMSSPSQTRLAHPPRSKRPFLESSSNNSRGKRRKNNNIKRHHAQLRINSDTLFYLYPLCEGLQCFCTEHKIKLSKIDHIFLTRVCSETAGGLPGLVLTLAGIGDEDMSANIWVPSDLDFLAGAMRSFIPNRAMLHTHGFGVEGNVSSSQSKDSVVILDDEVVRISAIFVKPRYESEANSLEDIDLKPGDTAIVYACELPEIKGKFDPAKAAALGLKPGPKYRELQLGNSVESDQFDKLVHPNDVLGSSIPGPTVILVDCPTQNRMQELFSLQALNCFYENSSDQTESGKKVNCIIHLGSSSVTKSVDYQSWMKKFGATQHIMAGHEIKNMEIPILKGSARISSRLNFICPQLFPSSGFWPVETANGGTEKNMYTFLETCESVPAPNLLKFHLRPYAQLGLDRASIPSLFTYEDIMEELISEIPEVREVPEHVRKFWHHNPDDKSTLAPVGSMLTVEEPWICFFLSLVSREEDTPSGTEIGVVFSDYVRGFVNHGWTSSGRAVVQSDSLSAIGLNTASQTAKVQDLLPSFPPAVILDHHPCENFSFLLHLWLGNALDHDDLALRPGESSTSPVLQRLNYLFEENSIPKDSNGDSFFGGHPSLEERDKSYDIDLMTVRCGFVRGKIPGRSTGFDIDEADLSEMQQCQRIFIASAIIGNYDIMQQPENISEFSKNTVCFLMFLDEETESAIKNSSSIDHTKRIELWQVVVVRNLPYSYARRNGKVPKLLLPRLFANNMRYSIWIGGKLKLVRDPYQVLERFLWRKSVSFAISRHYRHFDVFEDAEANKAGGKYDNASQDRLP